MMTPEQYYNAGLIPLRLDRAIKPDGTRMTRDEIESHRKSLRSHERKAAQLKMPTKRDISKFRNSQQANLGMSRAPLPRRSCRQQRTHDDVSFAPLRP